MQFPEMRRAWSAIFETVDRPTPAHSEHEPTTDAINEVVLATTPRCRCSG